MAAAVIGAHRVPHWLYRMALTRASGGFCFTGAAGEVDICVENGELLDRQLPGLLQQLVSLGTLVVHRKLISSVGGTRVNLRQAIEVHAKRLSTPSNLARVKRASAGVALGVVDGLPAGWLGTGQPLNSSVAFQLAYLDALAPFSRRARCWDELGMLPTSDLRVIKRQRSNILRLVHPDVTTLAPADATALVERVLHASKRALALAEGLGDSAGHELSGAGKRATNGAAAGHS